MPESVKDRFTKFKNYSVNIQHYQQKDIKFLIKNLKTTQLIFNRKEKPLQPKNRENLKTTQLIFNMFLEV